MRGRASLATDTAGWRRSEPLEPIREASELLRGGQVRGKCRITSCQFTPFSCTEDLYPERFFRVNIRSESERAGGAGSAGPVGACLAVRTPPAAVVIDA